MRYKNNKLVSIKELEEHVPVKEYFVGIDSDGTVFNSMELKHKDCFIGCLIRSFSFAAIAHEVHLVWNYVNIFSNTRGTNRFKALLLTFDYLSKMERIKELKINIPKLTPLKNWLRLNKALSNEALKKIISELPKSERSEIKTVYNWSEEVNNTVKKTVFNLPPMEGALNGIKSLKPYADIVVISNTPIRTLNREWSENNIISDVLYIGGQETGSKIEMLSAVTKNKYKNKNILIIGDSPGDLGAAQNVDALFFPIVPKSEEKSWEVFNEIGLKHFLKGTYYGEFQNEKIKEFKSILNIKPSWID